MENANEKFIKLMKIMATNYSKKLTGDQLEFYKHLAKMHGMDKFWSACFAHMNDDDGKYGLPNMANISKHINGTEKDKQACFETVARSQWVNVMRAIAEVGSYRTPNFKDPITRACITSAGGWQMICSKTTDELVWEEKSFIRNYQDYSTKPVELLPDHVVGMEDLQQGREQGNEVLKQLMDGVSK